MSSSSLGWAMCQSPVCPTHEAHADHKIQVQVLPWTRINPDTCPECGGELKLLSVNDVDTKYWKSKN